MPTSWRKLAVAGIAGVGTTLAFAAPAAACYAPEFSSVPSAECVTDNTAKVTWIVSPGKNESQSLVSAEFTVDGQKATGEGPAKGPLAKNSRFTLTVNRKAQKAMLKVKVALTSKPSYTATNDQEANLSTIDWSKCTVVTPPVVTPPVVTPPVVTPPAESPKPSTPAESPSASASESPSAPAESPSPSKSSAVAGASSSAAALPVTGASIAVIAGVAVVLLAAGAGIFLVARRRRVRFTAA